MILYSLNYHFADHNSSFSFFWISDVLNGSLCCSSIWRSIYISPRLAIYLSDAYWKIQFAWFVCDNIRHLAVWLVISALTSFPVRHEFVLLLLDLEIFHYHVFEFNSKLKKIPYLIKKFHTRAGSCVPSSIIHVTINFGPQFHPFCWSFSW